MSKIRFALKFLLGRIIYFISGFFRRDPNVWVFGSFNGFEDNPKYLYLHMLNENKEIRVVWLSKNLESVNKAKSIGGEAYKLPSLKGIFLALTSGVYIYSAYLTDIMFITSRKVKKVNLWHGIPIKKIEFDINSEPLSKHFSKANFIYRQVYAYKHIKPDLILCPSQYSAEYAFKSAFRVSDKQCLLARYPRVSALLEMNNEKEHTYDKVFLYMPTWRDSNLNILQESGIDLEKLNEIMISHNSLFIIKPHPLTLIDDANELSNIKVFKHSVDSNVLLSISDCLVSDYSSVIFDYLHLNRPIIFFNYDINEYQKGRELYFKYEEVICGQVASNFNMLLEAINNVYNNNDCFGIQRKNIHEKFSSAIGNDEDIVKKIKGLLTDKSCGK